MFGFRLPGSGEELPRGLSRPADRQSDSPREEHLGRPARRVRNRRVKILALISAVGLALPLAATAQAAPADTNDTARSGGSPVTASLGGLTIEVLSSRADQVSGGDALLRVTGNSGVDLDGVRVTRNGEDVTTAFERTGPAELTGLVDGLKPGDNVVQAAEGQAPRTVGLKLTNHPTTGPMFSGPQQYPFVCRTERAGLGQPLVDNQDRKGMRVFAVDANGQKTEEVIGWSKDCSVETRVDYFYRTTGGKFQTLPADGSRPADLAQATLLDGRVVDYVVRLERGTINRFIYSIAMLAPLGEDPAVQDVSLWNRRVIYSFQGGVGIGHDQGKFANDTALYDNGLSRGYAILYSTGTRTSTHYNLQVGGETALMVKERFVEQYGVPEYTTAVGGSGGGIQQYIYAQNHPGLLDAIIPQYSYPDMVTQTIHVGDCELLEFYMDNLALDKAKWQKWTNRTWLEGMNASDTLINKFTGKPGLTECIEGWRGLSALAMNPNWGDDPEPEHALMEPGSMDDIQWTHWADMQQVYGVDESGYARSTWDNVGVQYGLQALRDGNITAEEFLHLNATIGGWKPQPEMVQEGCPFFPKTGCFDPATWDPWSSRNMVLSPDGGQTPAPRTEGSMEAMRAAYDAGMVFKGRIDIPVIDWRHYLEPELDMHNVHQSFASRQRMIEEMGNYHNQVIWFTDGPKKGAFDQTPQALQVIDQWMANIKANPERSVASNKPAGAVDSCFNKSGELIAAGKDVWDGILNTKAAGACTQAFPVYSTSRIVAGGPIKGGIFKCQLQPVDKAIERGLYGAWQPSEAERARLKEIFPDGVCDYTKPDAGHPKGKGRG